MKLNEAVIELMFELSSLEGVSYGQYLNGDGVLLRNNLLKLFKATENPEAHNIIINIMSEAGYPWFERIAKASYAELASVKAQSFTTSADFIMSDDEFMELLPANGRIH